MAHTSPSRSPKRARPSRRPRRPKTEDFQVHPADLGSLFAKRPLVWGEDESEYDTLLAKVTAAVMPTDIIEAIWVKDITDLTWEAQRLRRMKAALITRAGEGELMLFLEAIPDAGLIDGVRYSISSLVSGYTAGVDKAVTAIDRLLNLNAQDWNSLLARGLVNWLGQLEGIERMIAGAEARRSRVLVDLDRRREAARISRRRAEDIEDVS